MVRDVSNRLGCLQSLPSISIGSCDGVRNTLLSRADGEAKRPRKLKTWPDNCSRCACRCCPQPARYWFMKVTVSSLRLLYQQSQVLFVDSAIEAKRPHSSLDYQARAEFAAD